MGKGLYIINSGKKLRGEVYIFSFKIDLVKLRDRLIIYKQFERRNGLIFMRMKKRKLRENLNS